jgi:hypothetical protein
MDNEHCSPKASGNKSCLNLTMLTLVAKLYNETHTDKIEIGKSKRELLKSLQAKMEPACGDSSSCWIEQPFIKNTSVYDKISKAFRPKKPEAWNKNKREWLNTYDILNVMKQYEEKDITYKFVGVFPVDFASKNTSTGVCIVQEMCQLNLQTLWKQKIKKIGIIFNTDRHDESGSHWNSLFIGLNPKSKNFGIFFYDSIGTSPPKEISIFMRVMKKELESLHPKYKHTLHFDVNKIRRQFKGTECGMFSMLFQIMMLKYKFDDVCRNMGYDDDVWQFRSILYRPHN